MSSLVDVSDHSVPFFPAPAKHESDPPPPPPAASEVKPEPVTASAEIGMFDLILRGQAHLTEVLREERNLGPALQKLLILSLLGLGVHGAVVGLGAEALHTGPFFRAGGHPILWMPIAFVLAFVGALAVCLPSFYFYTQLAGLDASFRLVTAQALRAQATAAVLLLGVTPFYAAFVLAGAVGVVDSTTNVILAGLVVPFIVGLGGVRALYRGFCDLAAVLPITHRRRGDFLRRMILCWAGVYTAVAPVALYRLAEGLSKVL